MTVDTTLRIASANAASGRDHRDGRPALDRWTASVSRLEVDVLAVQEVDHLLPRSGGVDQTAEVAAACAGDGPAWHARFAAAVHGSPGDAATMRPAPGTDLAEPSYGVALLSRHPVLSWHELRLRPSRLKLPVALPPGAPKRVLWAPDEQRVALAARVAAPAGEVTVVATHLSFVPTRATAQLREVVGWARGLPAPRVLVGDLNLPGGWPARVTGWTSLVRAATYPAPRPRVQLDHLLVERAEEWRVGATWTASLDPSDHLAVLADLTRAGGPGAPGPRR